MGLALDTLVDVLKTAGEPTRFRLLALLAGGDLTVTDLTAILGQSQPRISRHLKLLAEAGLIERFREDEREHRDAALAAGAEQAPAYPLLSGLIRLGCRAAIKVSERI